MARGTLRIYLGFAPGAGTTYALLDEARRRTGRGADVVVAALDTKGRPATEALVAGLELVGVASPPVGLDTDAVLDRHPAVAFVDDLAAVDGPARTPRWQAVERLRDAGIDVVSTLDVTHIESLADVASAISGRPGNGGGVRVPDAVVRAAEQLQLVDQTPEALRRRLAHGNIFPAEQVDAALDRAFRPDALTELRELTMRWLADRVHDRVHDRVRDRAGERGPVTEVREGILVALSGASTSATVLRRAARLADRQGARLVGVHVRRPEDPAELPGTLFEQRQLLEALGGQYLEVASDDVADALVRIAAAEGLTQLVVGTSRRTRWQRWRQGALVSEIVARAPLDVHVVHTTDERGQAGAAPSGSHASTSRRAVRWGAVSSRRQLLGWVLALALPAVTTAGLVVADAHLDLAAQLIVMLLAVTAVAAVGGVAAGVAAGAWGFALANWWFTPPTHELSIANSEDALSLVAFLLVAVVLGGYVSIAARRSADAARARADASALASLAGTAAGDDPLPAVVERLRIAYGGAGAALFERVGGLWVALATAGPEPPTGVGLTTDGSATVGTATDGSPMPPDPTRLSLALNDTTQVVVVGPDLRALDPEVTSAFLDQLAVTIDRARLRAAEEEARSAAAANELRAALLAAISHDLRTPLATVKAASSTLVQLGDTLDPAARAELQLAVDEGVDRLTALVVNLLGMGRIQVGAVQLRIGELFVDEVVHRAVLAVGRPDVPVEVDLAEDLPPVAADGALLEQVLVNLLDNACKWSPTDGRVRVDGAVLDRALHLRVIDRGPGIPPVDRARVLEPFQRGSSDGYEHADRVEGTGLGLAVASGFCRLMGVDLRLEDTPGGGTTATLVLPLALRADVRAGLGAEARDGVDAGR